MEDLKDRKINALSYLLHSASALSNEKNLNILLGLIMEQVTEALQADRSSLFLIDRESKELWSKVALKSEIKEIRFPMNQGIAGHVAMTKETVNIDDVYQDSRFNQEIDQKTGYKTKNMLCMPIINYRKKVIGVIQVINKKNGNFDNFDEELLTAFNGIAAAAVENSLLINQIKHISGEILKMNNELHTLLI